MPATAKALLPEISNLPTAHAFSKKLAGAERGGYERLILRQFWRSCQDERFGK